MQIRLACELLLLGHQIMGKYSAYLQNVGRINIHFLPILLINFINILVKTIIQIFQQCLENYISNLAQT